MRSGRNLSLKETKERDKIPKEKKRNAIYKIATITVELHSNKTNNYKAQTK